MDASSRQSEILEQLDRIRRELARKERKLQKLKRLSAQKRSCDSAESSSVIAVEDTRSPVSLDVRSPLRPIETTLSQSEICQSKPLRTVDLHERSVLFRGSNLDEFQADENACGRRSRTDGTRADIGERELPIGAQYGDVQASCAPSCGRTSPPAAPQGQAKVEQQKPLSSDVWRPLNESTPDETSSDAPLQTASHLSPHLVSLAGSADNSAAEASAVPTPAVCTPAGKELCSTTSVNVSKSKDTAVLNTADGLSTAVSVRRGVPQDGSTQLGDMSASTPQHSQRGDKHVANSSCVGSIGQSPKSSAYVLADSAPCIEKQFIVPNDIHMLSTLDGESLYDENMGNSQKEIFEDHEVHLDSQGTHCSSTSQEAATEEPSFESSEMSEPPWQRTETSCSSSSKSWSPVRKRRRTVCEVSVASGSADSKGYNFRQRRLSHNPLVLKRMSREAKTILGTFQKLIQQARKLPVSTFQLPFEQLGLAQYQEAKSVSGCRENHKRLRTSFCDIMSSEEQLDKKDVKAKECTRNSSPYSVQTTKTTSSFESLCAALSLLPKKNSEATPKAANCEKRETRSSRRQRGLSSSLPSGSACQESEPQFVTTSVVTCDFHSSKTVSSSSCTIVHSICSTAGDSCSAATDGVIKGSSDIHGHGSPETELSTASRLAGDQAIVPHCSKQLGKVEPSVPWTVVSEVGISHGKTEQSLTHFCVSRDASDQGTDTDAGSCEITAIEVPTGMTGGVCFQDVNRVRRNLIASPQEAGDHMRLVDEHDCYRINKQALAGSTHVVPDGNKCYSQEFDTNARQQDKSSCTALSEQKDTCKLDSGEDSGCDDGDGVLGAASPARSTLFTQSEESDGTVGEINEFVTTVVEQLDPQTGGATDCVPVDKSQDSQSSQSGSTTPDNLDFPEGHGRSPGGTPKHRSPPHGKQDPVSEFARGRLKTKEEGGLSNNVDKAQGTASPSLLDASDKASDHPLKTAELASGVCVPTPGLLGAKESDSGTKTADVHSHRGTPPPSGGARKTEELTASCLPGMNSRCVAKKLFTNSPVRKKGLATNSDFTELLDPQVLEGMFDEWSEGLDFATRPVSATDVHDRGGTSQTPCASEGQNVNDIPAVAGGCGKGTAEHTPVQVMHREVGRSPVGSELLSESSQGHQSSETYGVDVVESNCQSCCHEVGAVQEVEHGSPDLPLKGSIEAGRRLLAEDQCSQSVSSSLEALSGISRFSDEVEEKGAVPHTGEEQQLSCEDLGSPVQPGGMCDGLAEDHDGAGWDNLDDTYEEHCQGTPHHRGSSLGTHNPLLLSCTLKCEEEQPVAGVHLVQTATHPFLVSVQVSAINVWHLEKQSWRHSLVMRRLKFPVQEDHCLLACERWTVLVYLNARAPLYLPCLEWRTHDGQDGSQLLLTLGSLGSADGLTLKRSQRIYRIAKLSQEGQFATALRTTGGATLLRVHRLRHMHGELGDETDVLGHTSNLLDSLVCVVGQPDALLGNSANIFYVWDCNNRVLVKKMIHEPDMFADLRRISWCSSDRGLLFVLMQSSDDVTSALVAMNPFSCKAEPVTSLCWKLAAKACTGDLRSCGTQVEGRYVACVTPGYGVRIWNLFTGNPVANMWYHSSASVTMAELSGSMVTAVGLDDGRVLVFAS